MDNEKLVHDLIVDHMKHKLAREYSEIKVNPSGNPDLILSNHGLVLAVVEVETDSSIKPEKAKDWNALAQSGSKLILMVPKRMKVRVTEILWQNGMVSNIAVGTYEITVNMP